GSERHHPGPLRLEQMVRRRSPSGPEKAIRVQQPGGNRMTAGDIVLDGRDPPGYAHPMVLASPPRLLRRVVLVLIAAIGVIVPASLPAAGRAPGVPRIDASGIVWLCRPGLAANPCMSNLDTTVVLADGSRSVKRVVPAANPAFDC